MARLPCVLALMAVLTGCGEPTGPETDIAGERLFNQYCARCHGNDGKGTPEQPGARDLSDPRIVDNLSDERIKGVIRMGKPPTMPGFGDQFTEAKLIVLVAYVRSLAGSTQSRVPRPEPAGGQPSEQPSEQP